jgi:hypothetical protein
MIRLKSKKEEKKAREKVKKEMMKLLIQKSFNT